MSGIHRTALIASLIAALPLAACGSAVKGDFPQLGAPQAAVLTPEQVKSKTAELEKAKDARQTTDLAEIEGRRSITR